MSAVTMADILRHVPSLFDFVTGYSIQSLLGTNHENRALTKRFVKVMRLQRESPGMAYETLDFIWLTLEPYRSSLTILDLSGCNPSADPVLSSTLADSLSLSSFPSLRHLNLSSCGLYDHVHIHKLSKGEWPQLEYLDINCKDQCFCPEATAYLVQANWPLLKVLRFNSHLLTGGACLKLAQHEWPLLQTLDLGGKPVTPAEHEDALWETIQWEDAKGLNTYAVEMLVKCSWPLLTSMTLHVSAHEFAACYNLAWNTWSMLEILDLSGVYLDVPMAVALTTSDWSQLKELKLSCWSIVTTLNNALAILAQKTWSHLRSLEVHSTLMLPDSIQTLAKFQVGLLEMLVLADCGLTTPAIPLLVHAEWPLRELELSGNSYWNRDGLATEYQQLGNANWPYLQKLNVSGVLNLDALCLAYLSGAEMPCLEELNVQVPFTARAPIIVPLEELTKGDWPLLKKLNIGDMRVGSDSVKKLCDRWPSLHIT